MARYGKLATRWDDFNFPIVNSFLGCNIPSAPPYSINPLCQSLFEETGLYWTWQNCSLQDYWPRDITELNWWQHWVSSRGDTIIVSIPIMWLFPWLFLMFCHGQAISRPVCLGQGVKFDCIGSWSLNFYLLSKSRTYLSPDLSLSHLSSDRYAWWTKHSDLSFANRFMSLIYNSGTLTTDFLETCR